MPPKRAAAIAAMEKTESPSRRKPGRPKKSEVEAVDNDDAEEEVKEETPPPATTSPRKRGRPRKAKVEEPEDEDAITLDLDDIMNMPDTASPAKKRKPPVKSAAAKRGKSDTSVKDSGGAGDGENLIQCTLCDAKVVQLVRHIRAVHGDDPDYDVKIKEARSLEAKVQSSQPTPSKKPSNNLLDDLTITTGKMVEKTPIVDKRTTGERGNSLVRPKNTQCPICEKVVRRYDLNKHIRNVHSGEKPNKCPYCDYASPWKGNLNTHIAGVHTKARLHDCIRCGLSFKTRSAMIGHVRKVHDKMYQPKERLFECEECNKKFYKKFHLQRHIRVHTGEKPFTCAFCEKMFASKTNMDSHIQSVHLKIKPFKCGYCEKGFARKKMMLVHIRKYHMSKDDHVLLADMDDLDDITLDDNMDAESTGSVESGEILGPEDDGAGPDMVLIKMRDDNLGADDDVGVGPVKEYMFVPAEDLPSDLDNTLDTTAGLDTTATLDTAGALDDTSGGMDDDDTAGVLDDEIEEAEAKDKEALATSSSDPVVINVGLGDVVQAVQTEEGLVLLAKDTVASPAKSADKPASPAKSVTPQKATAAEDAAASPEKKTDDDVAKSPEKAAESPAKEKEAVAASPEKETTPADDEVPDLVQQALAETVPEVTTENSKPADDSTETTGAKAILSTPSADTELGGGLPANLLATEEGDQTEPANGDDAFGFLDDIKTNGN